MIVTDGVSEENFEKEVKPKGLSLFTFLLDPELEVIAFNRAEEAPKEEIPLRENFRLILQKLICSDFTEVIEQIYAAAEHCLKFQKIVVLDKQIMQLNNKENHFCCRAKFIPFVVDGQIYQISASFDDVLILRHQDALERIFNLEYKVFEASLKDESLKGPLHTLLKNLENYNESLSCALVIFGNHNINYVITSTIDELHSEEIIDAEVDFKEIDNWKGLYKIEKDIAPQCKLSVLLKTLAAKNKGVWVRRIENADNYTYGLIVCTHDYHEFPAPLEKEIIERVAKLGALIIEKYNNLNEFKKAQKIFKEIGATLPGVIFQFRRAPEGNMKFTYITEGVRNLYDVPLEDIYKDPFNLFSRVHEDDLPKLLKSIEDSAHTKEIWLFNFRVRRRKREGYRWVRGTAVPGAKSDGSVIWNGTLIDITELQEATEKVQESEKRYQRIFETNPLALMIIEKETLRIIEANEAAAKLLNYKIEEFENIQILDVVPGDEKEKLKENVKKLDSEDKVEMVIRNVKKDGQEFEAEVVLANFGHPAKSFLKIITDVSDKQRTAKLLQKQMALFKELFNAAPFGICLLNTDETILEINNAFSKLFGFSQEDIQGVKINEAIVPDDKKQESHEVFLDGSLNEFVQIETIRKRKDGSRFDCIVVRYPIIIDQSIIGYYGIYVDISVQKSAERNLRMEKEFVENIINSLPGIVYVIKSDLSMALWNENLKKITGYTDEEIKGLSPIDFFQGSDKEYIAKRLGLVFESGQSDAEAAIVSKTGRRTPLYLTGARIEYGEDTYVVGMGVDITERNKHEELLRIQRRALESVAEGVIITDNQKPDNPIIFVNPEFSRITGYAEEEVIGKNSRFLQGKKTSRKIITAIREAMSNQRTFRGEIINYRKDGSTFWNLMIITPVFNKNKEITHFVGMMNDITDIKSWQQKILENNKELKKINTELDRFVYSTSHDLRAPLASVLGLINISLAEDDPVLIKEFLNRMKNSINKLDAFIQDIVNYSRNSRLEIASNLIDFKEIAREVFESLKYSKGAEKISFNMEIQNPDGIQFFSDKSRLHVIFNNLVSNAIKYHDYEKDNLFVNVEARISHQKSLILISDNGQGIPSRYQKKIFDMFYRASHNSTGSGLGLYIVKEMIEKLDGKIWLESKEGEGSTFFIEIPNLKQNEA
jgi:PAS domain S-box-containing protein